VNPLLAQFLVEARDGLQDIDAQLLALEEQPGDADGMSALFRTVHTLKGNSGLFEFPELTRVLHAGEDLMDAVRRGDVPFRRAIADALLDAMDFVGLLLDDIEDTGAIATGRGGDAVRLAEVLRGIIGASPTAASPAAAPNARRPAPAWVRDALAARATEGAPEGAPLRWFEYTPDPECFFQGDDPLLLVRQIDAVVWQQIVALAPWPTLDALDPYRCQLSIRALVHTSAEALDDTFRYVAEHVRHDVIETSARSAPNAAAPAVAADDPRRALVASLQATQQQILALPETDAHDAGRRRAATLVASRLDAAASQLDAAAARQAAVADVSTVDTDVKFGRRAEDHATGARHLKVDQAKVDRLMHLIGEMVVAKNGLPFLAQKAESGLSPRELAREIKSQHAVMHRVAEELQDAIRQVRMLPMQFVFQRFPRLVRDISARLGKDVRLVLEGEDAEADKHIIEALADPLVHLVRNSLDHGLEPADVRRAAGKPAQGTLTLRATQDADRLHLTILDDGRGVDPHRVRQKAREKGLVTDAVLDRMSDHEAIQLIFLPGFSTADAISDLSGRGVGMDAVREAITRLGGDLRLDSTVGVGTTIALSLPLSMTVTKVMVVESAGQSFGVRMDRVVETVRIPVDEVRPLQDGEAMVRRGRVVPLKSVPRLLGQTDGTRDTNGERSVLVVRNAGTPVGLCVDDFLGTEDVMLSPMPGVLSELPTYAGSALLGDGSVLMVLAVEELLQCR
jgi:two-component system chemotaxis sensor kinase CheA